MVGAPDSSPRFFIPVSSFFRFFPVFLSHGGKLDPYQSTEDRRMKIQNMLRILVLSSIMVTTYAMLNITLPALDIRHSQPTMLSKYYLILSVICFQASRVDGHNFEVDRDAPELTP